MTTVRETGWTRGTEPVPNPTRVISLGERSGGGGCNIQFSPLPPRHRSIFSALWNPLLENRDAALFCAWRSSPNGSGEERRQSQVLVHSKQSVFGGASLLYPVLPVKRVKARAPEKSWFVYRIPVRDLPGESQLLQTTSLYNGYCFARCAVSSLADWRRLIIWDTILWGWYSFKSTRISWVSVMYIVLPLGTAVAFPSPLSTEHSPSCRQKSGKAPTCVFIVRDDRPKLIPVVYTGPAR